MADYIDRQAALNALCDSCDTVQAVCPHFPCKRYTSVEALSSADVQPVQYGEWIGAEAFDNVGVFYCVICGKFALTKTDFCPNCGARMQKGEET